MQLAIYCLVYPILWIISKLPWRLFYMLSTGIYILIYHIIRYRRKTVTENLILAFPNKEQKEIQRIQKASYKHMCDMFLEMIRSLSISEKEIIKRFHITNMEDLVTLENKNKSIIVMMGHYNSYEWTNSIDLISKFRCVGIYKPIKNKYFDRLVHRIRGRFNSRLIPSAKVFREMTMDQRKENHELSLYGLISDQSPKLNNATFWTDFMGIKVPAFVGGEVLSKRLGLSIFYLHVEKVKRGYYEATLVPISEEPKKEDEYYITTKFTQLLEEQIRNKPENYLWTHKRWKHRDAEPPKGAIIK
ncbi:lysophospholipid acyltransferase family protein [Aquimarina sp. 2201CG14-23]|uniref:lysophospholipid acyltransferase family protein n=1 Tax=Aquimarina mycalae TaxID=3040073 RepID=UPI002477EC71|nr:lysophospholipid acyltransferase family protein [Aquimarina sp. 2201CG14-23]MDH7444001.1 lysophospholipid acyltransferase family protein [Aquimarina sp. 2201CG14-23]